ncbi:hypothetical protein ACH5AI_03520 [Streptomyces collinus]|uniref:hypothetical protein n=1 Tax=Streptomyces collinus TaxID=42684 RepID=UPI0037895D15
MGLLWEWVAPSAPSLPPRGLPPPHPRFGLNGLVLKRGPGWWVRFGCPGDTPMPCSQFFIAFGSAGCVDLTVGEARRLWGVLRKGDRVSVWGRRPGT